MAYIGRNPAIGTQKVLDSLESQFNGSKVTFDLRYSSNTVYPPIASALIVSLGGVLQEPGTAYTVTSDTITFASAPTAGTDCWILLYTEFGGALGPIVDLTVSNNLTVNNDLSIGDELHGPANFVIDPAAIGDNTGTVEIKGNLTVQGTTTTINSTTVDLDHLSLGDNEIANFGDNDDLKIYHDGTSSQIRDEGTGRLFFASNGTGFGFIKVGGGTLANLYTDGAVELYHNNSKKFETTSTGVTVTGAVAADGFSLQDNETISFGEGADLQIYHNGSNSYIQDSGTGALIFKSDLYSFRNDTDTEQLAKFIEDGAVELYYDNSKKFETTSTGVDITGLITVDSLQVDTFSTFNGNTKHFDGKFANFGNSTDLQIVHDGNNSVIQNATGQFFIDNNASGGDLFLRANDDVIIRVDGNDTVLTAKTGGVEINGDIEIAEKIIHTGDTNTHISFPSTDYIRLTTSDSSRLNVTPNGYILLGTNSEPSGGDAHARNARLVIVGRIGNTADSGRLNLQRGSAASNGSSIGSLTFTDNSNNAYARIETLADATPGANDFPGKIVFSTTPDGSASPTESLRITSAGYVSIPNDSGRFTAGSSNDLQIYHDGSNSYIEDTGTGALIMKGSTVRIRSTTNENMLSASQNGAISLYHDNDVKLETTSTGIDVTGKTDTDTLNVSGLSTLQGTLEFDSTLQSYDPAGGAGSDTSTNAAIALPSGKQIVGVDDGYIRSLLSWSNGSNIVIGQQNTSKIRGIQLKPGTNAGVGLHYGGTTDNLKFRTTSTGVDVLGGMDIEGGDIVFDSDTENNYLYISRNGGTSNEFTRISRGDGATTFHTKNDEAGSTVRFRFENTDTESGGGANANDRNIDLISDATSARIVIDGNRVLTVADEGSGNGLDADTLDGQQGSYYLDYNNFTNTPTIVSSFDGLTGKTSGTGEYSTSGALVAGRGSGGVALTVNDGFGNANVTFNHKDGSPEQAGNSLRIETNVDSTSGNPTMVFEGAVASSAGGSLSLSQLLRLRLTEGADFPGHVTTNAGNFIIGSDAYGITWDDSGDDAARVYADRANNSFNIDLNSANSNDINTFKIRTYNSMSQDYMDVLSYDTTFEKLSISEIEHNGTVTIDANGGGADVRLEASDDIILNSGENASDNGSIYFRGKNGANSYRFAKSGQTAIEGFLSFESLTQDRTFTFPDAGGTIALTSDISTTNADTVDNLHASSFLRSDDDDEFTGTITASSDGSNPIILVKGNGPNFIRFASDSSGTVDADSIDFVYRATPNTLGFERSSDGTTFWTTDADTGVTNFNYTPTVSGSSIFNASNLNAGTISDARIPDVITPITRVQTAEIRANGTQLVLNAGEAAGKFSGQTAERIYLNSELGVVVSTSAGDNNFQSGWYPRNTIIDGQGIHFYMGDSENPGTQTKVGEITTTDTVWLRINNNTNKNIYTPRYIRADGGFFVDGTAKGINGSGNFIGGTISGASDVTDANTANTVVRRNNASDINCRLVRPSYQNQSTISGAMAYRVNNGSDNYIRFCSDKGAIRTFLGVSATGADTNYLNVAGDTATGTMTFNGRVNIRGHIDLSDSEELCFGSSDDVKIRYLSSNWMYWNFVNGNGLVFQDNGSDKVILEDSGVFRPSGNNTGSIGTSSNRWANIWATKINFAANSTDTANITTTVSGNNTYLDFNLTDDNNQEQFRWRFDPSGSSSVYNAMQLKPTANGESTLIVSGDIGIGATPGSNLAGRAHCLAIGDSDTGIAQNGDGQFEIWANNQEICNFDTGEIHALKAMRVANDFRVATTNTFPGHGNGNGGFHVEDASQGTSMFCSRKDNTAAYFNRNNNGGIVSFRRNGNEKGQVVMNSNSVSYQTTSDYRLKENVVVLDNAISRVKQLQPKRFNFIGDPDEILDGFLAHEAQAVVPESVSGTQDEVEIWKESEELPDGVSVGDNKLDEQGNTIPVYQGIDQAKLVPLLTAALQEAITKIEQLEARITQLEST